MSRIDEAGVEIIDDAQGLVTEGRYPGTPPSTAGKFAVGCEMTDTTTGLKYVNVGTVASPSWNSAQIGTSDITDGAITPAKVRDTAQAVTATADGLTTGLITAPASLITFVAVTSANAAHGVTLPAITSATIGQQLYLTNGATGYEILTPAASNNTINAVDSDGTNQLDVAASCTVRLTQVSATAWIAETIAATTIAVTAPDND